jgi:shikimate kinase
MQTRRHIFLIGFMGSGKTRWGQLLADQLDLPFLDLDEYVQTITGKSITDLFNLGGEKSFRLVESDALRHLGAMPDTVVATGGGTPCFFDNMNWMNENGTTVFLQTPPALILERLWPERAGRPLLAGLNETEFAEFIHKKLEERLPFYLQSSIVIEQPDNHTDLLKKMAPHLSVERRI